MFTLQTRAESLDVIGTKSEEFSSLLFTVTSTNGFYSPFPLLGKSGLKRACNVNIVETSSLRTLKIMPQNLKETVRS
jgi:hypothetical protein